MSDYSISATITADDSGFQKAIKETISGLNHFGDAFTDMSADAKQSFANLANQFKSIDAKAKMWGDTTSVLADKQRALKTEINRLIDQGIAPESKQIQDLKSAYDKMGDTGVKANNSISSSFAKLRDIMQGPIAALGMAKQVLSTMWDATIAQASKMEDMEAAFTPLVGGAENAKAMIAALNKEAATTPYELEGIGKVAKQLLPVLGNDVEAVTKTFRMLGDTAGGNIEKLDSITRGYTKAMLKGKVDMESLNMIAEAGVPIFTELAKSTGYGEQNMKAFFKAVTEGEVSTKDLTKAFKDMTSEGGKFYKGMEIASETLSGKLSTLSDNLKMAGTAIGNEMLPGVKLLVDLANKITGAFTDWATENDNLKVTFLTMIGSMTGPMGSFLIPTIARVRDNLGSWSLVFLSVQKVALTVIDAVLDYLSSFANNFVTVINGLLSVYNKVIAVIGGKPIKLIDKIDLADASGLKDKLKDVTDQIVKEKRELANLAIQADKTKKTQTKAISDVSEENEDAAKLALAWNDKVLSSTLSNLEREKSAAIKLAKDKNASAEDVARIAKKYDDQILAAYIKSIEAQRKASLAEAREKGADAQTVANINKYYNDQILQYQTAMNAKSAEDNDAYLKQVNAQWSSTFTSIGNTVKTSIGDEFKALGEFLVTGGGFEEFGRIALQALSQVLSTLGSQLIAMAAISVAQENYAKAAVLTAAAAAAFVASGVAGAMATVGENAKLAAVNASKLSDSLKEILRSGKSTFTDYLGAKQVEEFTDKIKNANQAIQTNQQLIEYAKKEYVGAAESVALAFLTMGIATATQNAKVDEKIRNLQNEINKNKTLIPVLEQVYDTVYKNNAVTAESSEILEKWASALQTTIQTYGATSTEVAALNESYQKLLNDALYPTSAALEENNENLKKNASLWTLAANATTAFNTQLSNLREAASGIYESFGNIGADIASSLVDGLTSGLNVSDFMTSMKEYITKIVVQTAVYTDEMTAKIAAIGARISSAMASGVSVTNMSGIVADLKKIAEEASAKAGAVTAVVSSAFTGYATGTNNATRGWHMVGEQGPELAYFGGGERVLNTRETASAMTPASNKSVTVNATFNSPKAMNQYEQMRLLRQYNRELAFKGAL